MGIQADCARCDRNPRVGLRVNKVQHVLSNSILLGIGQPWEHGQRQDLRSSLFGLRKITLMIAKIFVSLLQVERNGIMDSRADAHLTEALLKFFAVFDLDDIEVEDTLGPGRLKGKFYSPLGRT